MSKILILLIEFNFILKELTKKRVISDIIAEKVGIGSGRTYENIVIYILVEINKI
ncbi:hypothetical protein [Clostridium pasteurianum]|uniref:hypothetical protein n=1 Tax=Clostridium pasteurianum TaxID=1501 RepID=UPI0012BBBDCB|nr:hypothetical protein [Clostridium pasteurianum]